MIFIRDLHFFIAIQYNLFYAKLTNFLARTPDPRSRIYYAFMECSLFVQMLITFSGLKINNFLNLSSFNLKSGHDLAAGRVDPGLCRDNKCLCESGIVQIKYEISVLLSCRARFVPSLQSSSASRLDLLLFSLVFSVQRNRSKLAK